MPYTKFTLLIFLLFIFQVGFGQNIYNNWYFGKNAGITFNSTPPTFITGGKTDQLEGCASISNSSGSLLFYTDGVTVWDKNHNVMPYGIGLAGNWSSAQSALIVPLPGSATQYYIFTVTDWMNNGDLRYSIVDMNLNAGNGDILPTAKNIFLSTNQTEKLVAANATNCGVWVLSHQRDNNRFEARLVTSSGITPPVFSDVGSVHNSVPTPPYNYNNLTGVMKVSKNNRKIGLATLGRIAELFDFDATTGQITNPVSLPMAAPNQGYGVCFSPDNSKFYVTEGNSNLGGGYNIFQYDLSSGNATSIINSKVLVGRALLTYQIVGEMQIGPDGRLYFTRQESGFLGIIPYPNLPAPLCGFINDGISLGTGISKGGLPNEIRNGIGALQVDLGKDTLLCPGDLLTLFAPAANSYLWSTGAVSQTISVSTSGKYWVQVSNGACIASDTIYVTFSLPQPDLGNDTTLCQGESINLNAGAANSYIWSTGATSQTIKVNSAGQYWVKAFNGICFKADTINIFVTPLPAVYFGNDTTLCQGESVLLNAGTATSYLWSTGVTAQTIDVNSVGQYWVKAFNGSCFKADTINIFVTPLPVVDLGNDTTLCQGESINLNAGAANSYIWSTGATSQTIKVNSAGQYWVKAFNGICFKADTINISVTPLPAVDLRNDTTLCHGESVTLTSGTATNYLWSTGVTAQTIDVNSAGQYWVKAFNGSCFKADTINIFVTSLPVVDLGNDTSLCQGGSLTLTSGTATSYLWSTGATSHTINVNSAGQYWVKAFNGICFKADTTNISVTPLPAVDLGNDTTLCQGESVTIHAGTANRYVWSTGAIDQSIRITTKGQYWVKAFGGNCFKADTINVQYKIPPLYLFPSDTTVCINKGLVLNAGDAIKHVWSTGDTTQAIQVLRDGIYSVTINYFGECTKQYSTIVKFENCDCMLIMPNAFTPNMDGKNDLFKPAKKIGCQFLTFSIFNRWGQKVFETSDLNKGWDGKMNGINQDTGLFVWVVIAVKDGQKKLFKGTVTLVR